MPDRPIILILGPTAGGKTALAISLANALPGGGECVCADSMQVYRGMDLGTAKPTAAEQAAAPHHLLDVADPADDTYSVDTWLADAERAIADIRARNRWPLVVGGTNLYVQALLYGLFDGPAPDPVLRDALRARDTDDLRRELEAIDPAAAARIHPNDRKRTVRAIEVFRATGRPISDQQQEWAAAGPRSDAIILGLDYPPEVINPRINARVKAMVASGLVEEVRALRAASRLGPQAREALGYKQILAHLDGRMSLDEAIEQVKIRTRRYAKQQRTWLRRFRALPRAFWLDASETGAQTVAHKALDAIMARAATPGAAGGPGASTGADSSRSS